jgi:Amidase
MYTHGPLATTVADAALLLSVLAEQPGLARISHPGLLRIAVSTTVPMSGARIPGELAAAVDQAADLLRGAGHTVKKATPRYGLSPLAAFTRWLAGPAEHAGSFDWKLLERRSRAHIRLGRFVRRTGLVTESARQSWTDRAEAFFTGLDVLITPALTGLPPKAQFWYQKSSLANARSATRLTGFLAVWDLAGYPAMCVPAGRHPSGLPISVQLVAPRAAKPGSWPSPLSSRHSAPGHEPRTGRLKRPRWTASCHPWPSRPGMRPQQPVRRPAWTRQKPAETTSGGQAREKCRISSARAVSSSSTSAAPRFSAR